VELSKHRYRAVRREYRKLAKRYDARWAGYVEATVRETLRRLPITGGERVLDVACGTGALLAAIAAAHPGAQLTGLDLSPEMLAVAARRLGPEVGLSVGAAEALPFGDAAFDLVVSSNAFHFFPDPAAALAEMRRVLGPGGSLVVTDWCDDYLACRLCDRLLRLVSAAHQRIYTSAECGGLLLAAGFRQPRVERYRISLLWGMMTAQGCKPAA
jgi:ubiquinone/menaquinone biosynthesis C-methylase UbiE